MAPFKTDPKYASPEELIKRVRGLKCGSDFSADIFAIGMTLTELLLGVKIWKNMSDVDIMRVSLRSFKPNWLNFDSLETTFLLTVKIYKLGRGSCRFCTSKVCGRNKGPFDKIWVRNSDSFDTLLFRREL